LSLAANELWTDLFRSRHLSIFDISNNKDYDIMIMHRGFACCSGYYCWSPCSFWG